jgi:hypothetical protein
MRLPRLLPASPSSFASDFAEASPDKKASEDKKAAPDESEPRKDTFQKEKTMPWPFYYDLRQFYKKTCPIASDA